MSRPAGDEHRARWWSRVGVTGRLLVLVFLPLAILTTVAVPVVVRARHDASQAAAVDRQVPVVTALISGLAALEGEDGAGKSVLLSLQSGVPVAVASEALGVDLAVVLSSARATTDRALAALPPSVRATAASQIKALRAAMDRPSATALAIDGQFKQVESVLDAEATSKLNQVEMAAGSTSDTAGINRTLVTLGWCYDLVQAAAGQAEAVTGVWFIPAVGRQDAAIGLAHVSALFDEAGQRIARSGIPAVAQSWAALAADPDVVKYNSFVVDAEHGMALPLVNGKVQSQPNSGTINIANLAGAEKGIPARWELIAKVVGQASRAVRDSAGSLARTNTRTYQLWLTLLILAALAAAAVAVAVARSISRPLGRLAETARSVVDGHLDVDRLPPGGPKETAVVTDAFNALVANLRLMETKTQALARADFDDPVLSVPLPGPLGRSLQDSARVLSGSIQDRHDLQERLAQQATHDALTGLLNRPAAITTLDQAMARARREHDTTALYYIDLDNFKRSNDLYGQAGGDDLLRQVATRLSATARDGDIVARLGADDFLVLAERSGGPEETEMTARGFINEIARPVRSGDHHLSVTASIGISIARGDDVAALELLARAELALYQAKRRGGGGVAVYDETMQDQLAQREEIERDLADALAHQGSGLVLFYQPVIDTVAQTLRGVEALIRWDRPGSGRLLPDRFIPIAETSDLIIELDNWVMAAATHQMVTWSADPDMAGIRMSINVSGRHLISQTLPEHLRHVLARSGADPRLLTIEITETVLLDDLAIAATQLEEVRRLGVQVAVDDFGTGYTSLSHLQQLPVDTIKIDRSFVTGLDRSNDTSLIRMIIELGHHLGLRIITEGVETAHQFDTLRDLGSDAIQGYLFGLPAPPEQIVAGRQEPILAPGMTHRRALRAV